LVPDARIELGIHSITKQRDIMSKPLAIILAAGKGKRMGSDLPKVLLSVSGRPMIRYVIDAVRKAGIDRIVVVVGFRAELVRRELAGETGVECVEQTQQLGTGHAVMMCRKQLAEHAGPVLILAGDSPMVQVSSLRSLLAEFESRRPACILGTATKADPAGLGRVVRDAGGAFQAIIEEKDASPQQRAIKEVNLSTYVFRPDALLTALEQLTANNVQGEYYLTDCPGVLKAAGERVEALCVLKPCEALSINTPEELAAVEAEMGRIANFGFRIADCSSNTSDNPQSEIRNPKSK
jgi:bifunctional UDP-N-acetylglucosamine pyrophosphorylase/glucosamine-1-phosphate N-acetyltransferase/UDP-N-acetylglucosamine pyrophosphorylase